MLARGELSRLGGRLTPHQPWVAPHSMCVAVQSRSHMLSSATRPLVDLYMDRECMYICMWHFASILARFGENRMLAYWHVFLAL